MTSLNTILRRVRATLDEPIDAEAIQQAMVELHSKLSEPDWAIKDEVLRKETEQLLVQMVAMEFLR